MEQIRRIDRENVNDTVRTDMSSLIDPFNNKGAGRKTLAKQNKRKSRKHKKSIKGGKKSRKTRKHKY